MSKKPPRLTPEMVVNVLKAMTTNDRSLVPILQGRLAFASHMKLDPPNRDIDKECGYPVAPDFRYFRSLIDQNGIAARANNIWPDECWGRPPTVYESPDEKVSTEFEQDLDELVPRVNLWAMLHRVDRLSGHGQYGGLLYGFSDLGPRDTFDKPVPGIDPITGLPDPATAQPGIKLNYLQAYSQYSMRVLEEDNLPGSPRFMRPRYYQLEVKSPAGLAASLKVHWTRVEHVADNRDESETYGVPRLQQPLPYIYDIRKIGGSSAEMFWKGGFPGYQYKVNQDPLMGMPDIDVEAIREDIQAFMNGLQRYLTAENGEWASLAPQVADPTPHLTQQLQLLCASLGVPLMVFLGSMSGQLAANQNVGNWKERVSARCTTYLEPFLLRPTLNRLVDVGVLRRPKQIVIEWSDLHALSGKERAEVALKLTQAMMQFVSGKVEAVMPVLYYYTQILGLPNTVTQTILDAAENNKKTLTLDLDAVTDTGGSGGRVGRAPKQRAGRPTGSV